MRSKLIAVVSFAALISVVSACSSSGSCFDAKPSAGSSHVLGGVSPLSGVDAGARDASGDGWRVDCELLNCGPAGTCGPLTDSNGVTKAVCMEPC